MSAPIPAEVAASLPPLTPGQVAMIATLLSPKPSPSHQEAGDER